MSIGLFEKTFINASAAETVFSYLLPEEVVKVSRVSLNISKKVNAYCRKRIREYGEGFFIPDFLVSTSSPKKTIFELTVFFKKKFINYLDLGISVPLRIQNIVEKEGLPTFVQASECIAFFKARDTLVVWLCITEVVEAEITKDEIMEIENKIHLSYKSCDAVVAEAKKFKDWAIANRSRLQNIKTLDLSDYEITSVPEEVSELTQLENLDLSNNQLVKFPKSVLQLPNLKSVNLRNNKITKFPKELDDSYELDKFDLSENPLTKTEEYRVFKMLSALKV